MGEVNKNTTPANKNKAIRQKALREQLAAQGHVQHVIDISNKLADLDGVDLDATQVQRLKAAADIKKGLIGKYLPDLKSTELTGPEGGPILTDSVFEFIPVDNNA